ncbi:RAP protein, putative [Plasmodium reichenowi]|uniref:RAP protein, putative n=1 Tax=Plasmodium reichenowi TaxID=5854 RepID=A0A2P9DGL4_PLARE|nr:RAP protein, putative [Plasmodium reichenowi]
MLLTNVRFLSKCMKIKMAKRKSWVKRNKKWMLPKVENSYLKQEQDFTVPHKVISTSLNKEYEKNNIKDNFKCEDDDNNKYFKNILKELHNNNNKNKRNENLLKPHEYKKLLNKDKYKKNDDKLNLKDLLRKGTKPINLNMESVDHLKEEKDKEKKKKDIETFWYMPNPFEKKGVYGMKENSFYKSFLKDRERSLDKINEKQLNKNDQQLLKQLKKYNNSNNNNINNELLENSISINDNQNKEKKIRISPRKYWYDNNYSTPDTNTINTVKARDLRFLMMNEARLVRKGKHIDVELWLCFMNRVIHLSGIVHVRSLLRYLQTIASVKVINKKMLNDIFCEIFKRENDMKPKHYVYLFQSCSRLKWNDFNLIYALKNMTLCWSILRNNFLIKSANSISKLGLASNVYSKALQITLNERLNNFSGRNLKAIKAITFLEFFNEDMIIKFISRATFYKEHFNYYTRNLQILYLYIVLFHSSIYNNLTLEQRSFLQYCSQDRNLKKINKKKHNKSMRTLSRVDQVGNEKGEVNLGVHNSDGDNSDGDNSDDDDSDGDNSDDDDSDGDNSDDDDSDDDDSDGDNKNFDNNKNVKIGNKICGGYTCMLHKEVSDFLNKLNIEHLNSINCGPFMVDIYHPSSNYIIELNAHFQYYFNSESLTTLSKWRHKFLSQMGYKVIHISYRIWNNLHNDTQKMEYIYSVLPKVILESSSYNSKFTKM